MKPLGGNEIIKNKIISILLHDNDIISSKAM